MPPLFFYNLYALDRLSSLSTESERERFACHYLINQSECCIYFVNTNREKSTILKARVDHSLSLLRLMC